HEGCPYWNGLPFEALTSPTLLSRGRGGRKAFLFLVLFPSLSPRERGARGVRASEGRSPDKSTGPLGEEGWGGEGFGGHRRSPPLKLRRAQDHPHHLFERRGWTAVGRLRRRVAELVAD